MSTFKVNPHALIDAAYDLWDVARAVSGVSDDFRDSTQDVSGACGNDDAGAAFASLRSSWSSALNGLTDALSSYERNTETAAILYEQVDRSVVPSTPPPPPDPFAPPPQVSA